MTPVTVRLATLADIPVLVELMRESYAEASFPLEPGRAAHVVWAPARTCEVN